MSSTSSTCGARRAVICVISSLMIAGCSGGDSTGNQPTPPVELEGSYPENRGQYLPIMEISGNSSIRWEDPAEIVYHTVGSAVVLRTASIRALRLSDVTSRTIHTGGNVNYLGYRAIEVSADGSQVYAVLQKSITTESDLFHMVPGAAPVRIAINPQLGSSVKNSVGVGILSTPDSRGAVYAVAPDSMRMYDAATRISRRIGEGCHIPVAFSPDGARLLCRTGNSFFMMTVADGSIQGAAIPGGGFRKSVFWGPRGLQVLVQTIGDNSLYNSLSVVDVATGSSTPLVKPGQLRLLEGTDYPNIAWSRDGRKVAVSTWRRGAFTSSVELVVYVIDTETAVTQRVAVHKLATTITEIPDVKQMAFSPDGRSIAYVIGTSSDGQVYLAPVL